MKKYSPFLIAGSLMFLVHALFSMDPLIGLLQVPSGYMASFFLGAPAAFQDGVVQVYVHPFLTVSTACSGTRLFAILAGLGGGYWCGRRPLRWLALLPLCYLITLVGNSARIVVAWQFRRLSDGYIPEWLQEFSHMGIGMVWSLTLIAALFYWIARKPVNMKEPSHDNA